MSSPRNETELLTATSLRPLALTRAAALGRSAPVAAWTPLGTVDAGAVADVDGAGSVQLRRASWSLDWWIGAEDRWHHPSAEASVRQRWLDDGAVVETAVRVPGGDVVHRAYAVRAGSTSEAGAWDDSAVVVEVENLTAVPIALAFAVRPFTLAGDGHIERIESSGSVVRVDGRVGAVLSREPARLVVGPTGHPAILLTRGEDQDGASVSVEAGPAGIEAAFVVPLPHTATVQILLPRVAGLARRRLLRSASPAEADAGWTASPADAVAAGWVVHTRDAASVELPEPSLTSLVAGSQRSLSVAAGDRFLDGNQPGDAARRAAAVVEALAISGLVEPLGPLARALVASQRLNGQVRLGDRTDATVALVMAGAALLPNATEPWTETLLGPVAKAVHRLGQGNGFGDGAIDAATAAEGLARLGPAFRSIGQPDVAAEAERISAALTVDPDGGGVPPSPPSARADLVDRLVALRARLRSGDADAVVELAEIARSGGPGALVDRVDEHGVPDGIVGFDPAAVASRCLAVLDLVLVDLAAGPALLPSWPSSWWGQPVEAHRVRTRWGRVSFGLRWHGERPAILWEIDAAAGLDPAVPPPVLTAPGLDPSWRGQGFSGEALLNPVAVPATVVAIRGSDLPSPESAPTRGTPGDAPSTPPAEGQSFS